MWDGVGEAGVNISVLITNYEPVLSKVVYENYLCCTESVFAFAVCQHHLLDSPPLINGWYSKIQTCCYGLKMYNEDAT